MVFYAFKYFFGSRRRAGHAENNNGASTLQQQFPIGLRIKKSKKR
jgi:hypothetical protein